jgi:hypothetical protein
MKKAIIISCIAASLLIILGESGILDSLLFFLLVGAVPGTSYTVPWSVMLLIIIGIMWLVIFRFAFLDSFQTISSKKTAKAHAQRKKRMPKRRFEQVV